MSADSQSYKVSGETEPRKLAGAIAASARESKSQNVVAIGAPAVNQAIKAIIVARQYLREENIDVSSACHRACA